VSYFLAFRVVFVASKPMYLPSFTPRGHSDAETPAKPLIKKLEIGSTAPKFLKGAYGLSVEF
jgi:hypothetical protein